MADERVREAYAARSDEYAVAFGRVEAADERDRALIASWAAGLSGRVIDAGCGPGHWTDRLRLLGVDVEGIDLVPEFVRIARRSFPGSTYRVGSLRTIDAPSGSLGGILAWYSLIHVPPDELDPVLAAFATALRPGGSVLIGFFEAPSAEPFEHAVTTAWYHSLASMRERMRRAGLEVAHSARRGVPGVRGHGEVVATLPEGARR